MNVDKYNELIAQFLSGDISESDRKKLMEWVATDANNEALLKEAEQLWNITNNYDSDFETDVEAAWNKIEVKIENKDSSAEIIRLSTFKRILQIAAVFLIAMAGWFLFSQNNQPELLTYQTGEEETKEIQLPDDSRVIMNENSTLTYVEDNGKRNVTLEGEAWFDVERLETVPFEILSGEAKTRVLGTAFNVRAYPIENIIEVSVEEGLVEFSENTNAENKKELPAGTEGIFVKEEKRIESVERQNDNVDSWRTLTMDFDKVNFNKVFETIERYFEIEIEVENPAIGNCPWGGIGLHTNPKLEDLIGMMEFMRKVKFTKNGNTYTVTGEGCPLEE